MTAIQPHEIGIVLRTLDVSSDEYAVRFIDRLLQWALHAAASDIHLQPTELGLTVRCRLDGVLHELGEFATGDTTDPVARLKVMARLLTYRQDVPQEGRLRDVDSGADMRVCTFPTLYGERAVVRFLGCGASAWTLDDLGLPLDLERACRRLLAETSGAMLVTGPAGSGKTTTCYASLREIAGAAIRRSIISLEDPIESSVPGVAQSQVNEAAGFTLVEGLRSIVRQDPEVIFVGEIRDNKSAMIAMQAALTGQLVLTTFHATSAAGALTRLRDLGVPPYVLSSGIRGILNQRLLRRLCKCATPSTDVGSKLGIDVRDHWTAIGCPECHETGYRGRMLVIELVEPTAIGWEPALIERAGTRTLHKVALESGMTTQWVQAIDAIETAQTTCAEARRVLGFDE